ncbi:phage holin family protein [Sphingomonas mesophila]|uniref:phage holin family protein n=1 Tax=Sphingomonas mesophila TaxID=2303576 RepID=UPI0013C3217A|nr:phage holin family protein [Sphingomonas mesophila]
MSRHDPQSMHEDDAPIGETVSRLVDEGKAYARAELDVARAKLDVKMVRIKAVAALGGIALLLVIGAFVALAMTAVLALASLLGPLGGGLAATLLIAGLAGLFAFLAYKRWSKGDE